MPEQTIAESKSVPHATRTGWEKWHDWNTRAMQPVTDWICAAAELSPGMRVLDLACGTGLPALAIAERIGPGGKVIATDLSPDMLAVTARNAHRAGLSNVECAEMNAERLVFPDDSFDVVTCAFGVMFCQDPARAFAEIRRVLVPGGRFAVAVWDEPAKNPFFTTVFQPVVRALSLPPPDPSAPGMYALSPPDKLSKAVGAGGFSDCRVESLPFIVAFESAVQHWQVFSEMAPPVKTAKETLPASEVSHLQERIVEALGPYTHDGRVLLPATALCATGRK